MIPLATTDVPRAINDAGCVAGFGNNPTAPAYRTCGTVRLTVGSCGGLGSKAWAINTSGQVAGDANNGVPVFVPFRWSESDGMICLSGSQEGSASGLNDDGWVVGTLGVFGIGRATLWKVK
jgi:uncharacterized membrane protein